MTPESTATPAEPTATAQPTVTAEPTLHGFVMNLLSDTASQQAFDHDPVSALSGAGLPDVTPQDVMDAIPLVLDLASAAGDGFTGQGGAASPFGVSGFNFDAGSQGQGYAMSFDSPLGGGGVTTTAGLTGVTDAADLHSPLGTGGFALVGGMDGFAGAADLHMQGMDALGLDQDTIGKGGDAVTGTVAGYLTGGADSLAGALTDGAGLLSGGLVGGADTSGGLITNGAGQLAGTMQDPTSAHLPAVDPTALAAGLPMEVPAALPLPAAPALPGLGDLTSGGLPHLPIDLPHLPLDLPALSELPAAPALPALPSLPSVPGVDAVHDTVGGLTSHLPLVGDLTDGVDNHLPFGH